MASRRPRSPPPPSPPLDAFTAADSADKDTNVFAAVEREIAAFLDAFERSSVSEFAWVSTSSVASTVSASASLPDDADSASSFSDGNTQAAAVVAAADAPRSRTPTQEAAAPAAPAAPTLPPRRAESVDRLSVESMELAAASDVNALLLALERKLQCAHAFGGEEERTKWWWLVHQLKQQRQRCPKKWDARADASLARIELAITNLPTATRSAALSVSGGGSSGSFYTADELRLSINDVPMLESAGTKHQRSQQQQLEAADDDTSWANFSRIVRAASGRTVRALIGSNDRDSELASTVNSGGGGGGGHGTQSRSSSTGGGGDSRDSIPTLQRSSNSFSQSVPQLLRSVVSYLGLSMEETFLCQICFENVSLAKAYRLRKCGHLFCDACLESFLQFKISEGQVYPTCFHQDDDTPACGDEIVPDDIQAVVTPAAWAKYLKFKFNKEHENARQCPHCDYSSVYRGSEAPECVCAQCGGEFCFVHSTAHRGRSCAEYEKKIVAIEKLNHAMINEISKPCPGCNNFVEKIGGCNQMKCVVCSTSFCWICREIIDDSVFPEHFQWWNIRGCPGNQMAEVEENSTAQTIWLKLLRGVFFLVFGPPAFVLAVVFSLLCCCCAPCTKVFDTTYRNAFTTCLCASGYLLLAPFALVAALVCSPCLCFMYWYDPEVFTIDAAATNDDDDLPDVSMQDTAIEMTPDNDAIFRVSA